MKIIILAGGGGTRLFPLSRACYPKQFLRIGASQSLFGQTVERFLLLAAPEDIVVVTQEAYFFHVRAELREAGADAVHVLLEPVGRNTAPAIALAMAYCRERLGADDSEVFCVSPSDHVIRPADRFAALVRTAAERAAQGDIVTLGVTPNAPETGYGYIEAAEYAGDVRRVRSFKEKPSRGMAEEYLRAGNYYWNSGMFLFRMDALRGEFNEFVPELSAVASGSVAAATENFAALPSISIDYAVAERSKKMAVAPLDGISWNDVGSFDAIAEMMADADGNSFSGDVRAKDCRNTMILGDERLVVGLHLSDLLVVDTPDVLLVARKGESQEIREVVGELKKEGRRETEENVTMYRPWGKYTTLAEGDGYKVKRIVINPGQSISLQIHYHRSEHWTVISGTGKLTLNEKEIIFRENESTYIPIGTAHRLENPGKLPLSIIEVQNGKYLEEDDIVRLDDAYGRVAAQMKEDA